MGVSYKFTLDKGVEGVYFLLRTGDSLWSLVGA